jgi:peptidoglycan hydrolase-like protein with peptidoglycan-binding domain
VVTTPVLPTVPVIPTIPVVSIEGCATGNAFSTTNGKACPNSVTTPVIVPGCTGIVGFSITTGVSCAGNTVTTNPVTNTGPTSYNFGTTTLRNGSKGEPVKELQRFLNRVLNLGLVIDGKLGPKTILVIKQWQRDHGLVADGLVGAKTKGKMNASIQ